MLEKLAFISVKDGEVAPLTHQIFSADVESLSCQVLIKFKSTYTDTADIVGSFQWYVRTMMTLRDHLKFEEVTQSPLQVRYNSTSESAARALQDYVQASEKFAEITEVHVETSMSAQAPDFKPSLVTAETVQPQPEDESMTAEEVKLQQISQLYQYYSNLIIQQDQRLLQDYVRAPRLGNPNHFSKAEVKAAPLREKSPAFRSNNLLV